MTRLLYDFADKKQAQMYPRHGWAINSHGVKILWLPLLHLVPNIQGNEKGLSTDSALHGLAFCETVRKLAISLQEFHKVIRVSCDHPVSLEHETLNIYHKAQRMVPLYVDLTFVYLRRIADLLTVACRPILFDDWRSAPQKFKKLVSPATDLSSLKPICDLGMLQQTIANHSNWFSALRGTSPTTQKKGVRDALEHRSVRFIVNREQVNDDRPTCTVQLSSPDPDVEDIQDLSSLILCMMADFCELMSGVHAATGRGKGYDRHESLVLVGEDDDLVGYWPEI